MTSMYEEGLKLIDEKFGKGKDNLISLATIARESGVDGKPRPVVRCIDAYYEDCTFYAVHMENQIKCCKLNKIPRFRLRSARRCSLLTE